MKNIPYELRRQLQQGKWNTAIPVKADDKYQVGQWYWCGYWHKAYKVLDVEYSGCHLEYVTVLWEDGTKGTHCTSLDPRFDYRLYK